MTDEEFRASIIGGVYDQPTYEATPEEVKSMAGEAYPFGAITEIYETGKQYAGSAIQTVVETAKDVVAYPYEAFVKPLVSGSPTGIIKDKGFNWQTLFQWPYILIPLSVFGLWVFGIFKKR